MEIFGIQTHSHEIQTFYEKIASYVTLSVFENQDALILSLDSCEIVLVDAFTNESKAKKLIQKIKKANADVTVWAIVNHTSKKFIKNIKTAKNSSVDEVIELEISDNDLIELLNEKKSLVNKDDTRTVALKILEDHSEVEMSSKAKEISHKLDSLFSSVYFILPIKGFAFSLLTLGFVQLNKNDIELKWIYFIYYIYIFTIAVLVNEYIF